MKIKNLPLVVGVSLPFIAIIVLSLVIFTPNLSIKPEYNFLYTVDDGSYYGYYRNTYAIENGRLIIKPIQVTTNNNIVYKGDVPTLYFYDTKQDTSRLISVQEVASFFMVPGPSSPDGYTVSYQYGHNGIFELFGSDTSNRGYFISKGSGKKRLGGLVGGDYYLSQQGFKIIGWTK